MGTKNLKDDRDKMLVLGTKHTVIFNGDKIRITPILIGHTTTGWKIRALNHESGQVRDYHINDLTPGW